MKTITAFLANVIVWWMPFWKGRRLGDLWGLPFATTKQDLADLQRIYGRNK